MGLFKDKITGWFSPIAIDGKYDLKSFSETIKLLIEVNNSELNGYTGYLIALFSVFTPIYIALGGASIFTYIVVIELNAIILLFLLRKIKNIKIGNEIMIEQYNAIQSEIGGGSLVKVEGENENVLKKFNEWNKKFNLKLFTPKFNGKLP